jgi:hypothetical protein
MKTAKYYRLHNNYDEQSGGGGRWKAFKEKAKNYGSAASRRVSQTFKTQSYQAKQKAINAMTKFSGSKILGTTEKLSGRDYNFMKQSLANGYKAPKTSKERQIEKEKLIRMVGSMTILNPINSKKRTEVKSNLALKTREQIIDDLRALKNTRTATYATDFDHNKISTKQKINVAQKDFQNKEKEYLELIQTKQNTKKALLNAKEGGLKTFRPEEYKNLKKARTNAKKALDNFKKKKLQTLQTLQASFLTKKAAYNKDVNKYGTINALEETAQKKTVAKRVYGAAKKTLKGIGTGIKTIAYNIPKTIAYTIPKTVAKAVWSPIKTYRSLTEQPNYYVNKLSTHTNNGKKKTEYEQKLKQHMNDPVKRAQVEKYISALTALTKLDPTKNTFTISNSKTWNDIKEKLDNNDNYTSLSTENQKIVRDGLRAQFMKYKYDSMTNTVQTQLQQP